ncbi:MAG: pyridoxamine 5'-phosphate oxidase family protein [Burkholderiaceae bacterium]
MTHLNSAYPTTQFTDRQSVPEHEARERLWSLIKDIRFAMFTVQHAASGQLQSRPMTTQNSRLDEDSSLWFFMSRQSETAADLRQAPAVSVVYADPGADAYVSISGHAAIVDDVAKKEKLWSKMAEAWFPQGPADPDLALVQVRITQADYWDVKESKLVQLLKMAKAAVTGKPPTTLGERAEVRMG